jgi:hypothetical protein
MSKYMTLVPRLALKSTICFPIYFDRSLRNIIPITQGPMRPAHRLYEQTKGEIYGFPPFRTLLGTKSLPGIH